ncbi:hypothetical protein TGGT1_278770 [Toxoplasma gondii GT1]|uniref:Uncharacterized protein n=8 Tax=Toxoplasma gondii TaxID=5811 RepID=S7UZP2_TOXGG|nr:hypothetical protein TGGT1_278770 [Toxoplasma gondii GT1]KAF4638901.1 hypothetical protein TGRH88_065100 [Toxoplasma gondii]KFG46214.1 hypothetical protein TGFOU_278770 [Toxoplasma gondii FOU]
MASQTESAWQWQVFGSLPSSGKTGTSQRCASDDCVSGKEALCDNTGRLPRSASLCQSLQRFHLTTGTPRDSMSIRSSRDACAVYFRYRAVGSCPETECRKPTFQAFPSAAHSAASKSCGSLHSPPTGRSQRHPAVYGHWKVCEPVGCVVTVLSHLMNVPSTTFLAVVFIFSALTFFSEFEAPLNHLSVPSARASLPALGSVSASDVLSVPDPSRITSEESLQNEGDLARLSRAAISEKENREPHAGEPHFARPSAFSLYVSGVLPFEKALSPYGVSGTTDWKWKPDMQEEHSTSTSESSESKTSNAPAVGEDTRQADEEVSAYFNEAHGQPPFGRSIVAQRVGILRPPPASSISTRAVPATSLPRFLRLAPAAAALVQGGSESGALPLRNFVLETLSCFHAPLSSVEPVRVTPAPFPRVLSFPEHVHALFDLENMQRIGEEGPALRGGEAGEQETAKRGGKGNDGFRGIVSQVIGLATDFDGTVTEVRASQKSETEQKKAKGDAKPAQPQVDYVDTCVTLFSLARQRASDQQIYDQTVDEAVRVYNSGRKRILSQLLVDAAGNSVEPKREVSPGELKQDDVRGWCACLREDEPAAGQGEGDPRLPPVASSPTVAAATTEVSHEATVNAIQELDAYEEKMANTPLTRIILKGIRKDTFDADLLQATNAINLVRQSALEVIVRLRMLDIPVTFISHSWSAHLVAMTVRLALAHTLENCLFPEGQREPHRSSEHGLQRRREEQMANEWAENMVRSMTFHANELVYDQWGVSTGLVEPRCVTLEAKRQYTRESREAGLELLRRRRMVTAGSTAAATATTAQGRGNMRENFWLVFVGDTHGDILALLEADIGILLGDPRKNMEAVLHHTGTVLRPLSWLVEHFRRQLKERQEAINCAASPGCSSAESEAGGAGAGERPSQFLFRLPAADAPCCCRPSALSLSFLPAGADSREPRCRVLYVAQSWNEISELLFGEAPAESTSEEAG